jgi:TP901-1 family phage major tail protein
MTTSARTGRTLLLRDGTGTAAVTIAAMRTTSFTLSGETIDVTDKDSPGQFRELLGAAGTASVSISANGLLSGSTQSTNLASRVLNRSLNEYRVEFDNGDTLEGPFQIVSFEAAGEYNGLQTYSLRLESGGSIALSAV